MGLLFRATDAGTVRRKKRLLVKEQVLSDLLFLFVLALKVAAAQVSVISSLACDRSLRVMMDDNPLPLITIHAMR